MVEAKKKLYAMKVIKEKRGDVGKDRQKKKRGGEKVVGGGKI